MTRTTACASAAAALSAWTCAALGQPVCEPGWGEPFPNAPEINSEVRAIVMFDDGSGPKLYAGGIFTQVGEQPARGFMRWEDDHWVEAAVVQGTGLSGYPVGIYYLTVMDIGGGPELFAGGQFSSIDGVPVTGIARWDGQTWSAMGAGFDLQARALAMFDDGGGPRLYAAGRFTKSGTTPCRGVARWTGSAWEEVGGGLGQSGTGMALGVYDLGQGPRLYVGGSFQLTGTTPGQYWGCIAAWDGASWSGLAYGFAGPQGVLKMLLFDYGSGPQLTVAGGLGGARVARWTGSQWVQVGLLPGDYVSSMAVLPGPAGPTLHIGGLFTSSFGSIARLENGEWKKLGGAVNSVTRALITTEEGGQSVLYASGFFSQAGDVAVNRVGRWDGQSWAGLEHPVRGLSGTTGLSGHAACVFNDGTGEKVFVGGRFEIAGDRVRNSIAAWDGQEWHAVGGGLTPAPAYPFWSGGDVNALATFDDGGGPALYATGYFEVAGGALCKSFARWDGATWTNPGGSGLWSWYQYSGGGAWGIGWGEALAVHDDGSGPALYVGGRIHRADSVLMDNVARWNGAAWSSPGGGIGDPGSGIVAALAEFDEGAGPRLFAGGSFKTIGGVQAHGVARWDGAAWSPVGSGFPPIAAGTADVTDLAVISSGTGTTLVAAGRYGYVTTPTAMSLLLARWNGQSWTPLTGGSGAVPLLGHVRHVWSLDDGDGPALYVGGVLYVSGVSAPTGLLRRRAGVWDMPGGGITETSSYAGMGVYGTAIRREGEHDVLLMTGWFDRAGGVESVGVAEWRLCRACYSDCNRDGALTPADFGCFQSRFLSADPYADCDTNGLLLVQDFACFQTKFVQGCP